MKQFVMHTGLCKICIYKIFKGGGNRADLEKLKTESQAPKFQIGVSLFEQQFLPCFL